MRIVRRVVMVLLSLFCYLGLNTGHASNGGSYTDLFDFNGTNGALPIAELTLSGGVLYGTTANGGTGGNNGVLFSYDPSTSTYTPLFSFTGMAGMYPGNFPAAALTLNGGILYGTTTDGGMGNNNGMLFSFNPSNSTYTPLYNFSGGSGFAPSGALALSGGVFYGTTQEGGSIGNGVIFSFDPSTSIYTDRINFTGMIGPFFGSVPVAPMISAGGVLYGTTRTGGMGTNFGVMFSFDPLSAIYTVLHYFDSTLGANPEGALILDDGVFYGTTENGGAHTLGVIFSYDPSTTTYTDLYDFDGTRGANPQAGLTLSNGVFYGTTVAGGANSLGVIFSYDPSTSTYTDLYDFDGNRGANPQAALTLDNGVFYGTTVNGGANNLGVIFSFSTSLLAPPSSLTGRQKKNDSGVKYEWFNKLKWQPPTLAGTDVASYNIYRNGEKIATLPASTLHYEDHNRTKGVKTLYSVTAINVQGNESNGVDITVP